VPVTPSGLARWRVAALVVTTASIAAVSLPVAATAAPSEPPRRAVAVIGDFGSGSQAERRVSELVASARPVAVVTTGDNVYDDRGFPELIGAYYGRWVAGEDFLPAVGNHDHAEGIGAFDDYFDYLDGRHVYSFGRGGMRFFVLDSTTALESESSMTRQRAWLKRSLQRSAARWKVVVLHHPPYSSGAHASSTEFRWPFGAWGADLVLSGHDHDYERVSAGGTTFVVNGAGGQDLRPFGGTVTGSRVRYDGDHGALFLTATDRSLTGEFWSASGDRVDRFVLRP
jgi:tartrate-resistant acid phosphatase type 5